MVDDDDICFTCGIPFNIIQKNLPNEKDIDFCVRCPDCNKMLTYILKRRDKNDRNNIPKLRK